MQFSTLSGISFPQNASLAPVNKITGENPCCKILYRETLRKQMFLKGVFLKFNRVSKKHSGSFAKSSISYRTGLNSFNESSSIQGPENQVLPTQNKFHLIFWKILLNSGDEVLL